MFSKTIISGLLLATIGLILITSCNKEVATPEGAAMNPSDQVILNKILNLPTTPYNYTHLPLPDYLTSVGMRGFDNTPAGNPITNEGATLGRVLFYDKLLSGNLTTSCGSCHIQANSFADVSSLSTGFAQGKTRRNSMSLTNARYFQDGRFFWDLRAGSLEEQVLHPVQDPVEMGSSLSEMESRLSAQEHYKILFRRAFGDETITSGRVAMALAQFIRTMVSCQSKFDEGKSVPTRENGYFVNFTPEENNGKHVFETQCGRCHSTPLQMIANAQNNGLDLVYTDNGVGEITKNPADNGKFKTPSLRNVTVTAPYMHDGRFATLEEVIDHYNEGVKDHPNIELSMREFMPNGPPKKLNMTKKDKEDLVAFLHTLTDEHFLTDVKYSDPFRK